MSSMFIVQSTLYHTSPPLRLEVVKGHSSLAVLELKRIDVLEVLGAGAEVGAGVGME